MRSDVDKHPVTEQFTLLIHFQIAIRLLTAKSMRPKTAAFILMVMEVIKQAQEIWALVMAVPENRCNN